MNRTDDIEVAGLNVLANGFDCGAGMNHDPKVAINLCSTTSSMTPQRLPMNIIEILARDWIQPCRKTISQTTTRRNRLLITGVLLLFANQQLINDLYQSTPFDLTKLEQFAD